MSEAGQAAEKQFAKICRQIYAMRPRLAGDPQSGLTPIVNVKKPLPAADA
jgi:hypothetical protein